MTAQREPRDAGGALRRRAFDASRGDRDRALEAMSALEAAAGKAGPGRDESWRAEVMTAVRRLQEAIDEQQESYGDRSRAAPGGHFVLRSATWSARLRSDRKMRRLSRSSSRSLKP